MSTKNIYRRQGSDELIDLDDYDLVKFANILSEFDIDIDIEICESSVIENTREQNLEYVAAVKNKIESIFSGCRVHVELVSGAPHLIKRLRFNDDLGYDVFYNEVVSEIERIVNSVEY